MGSSEPMTLKAKPLNIYLYRKHLLIALLQPIKRSTVHSYLIKKLYQSIRISPSTWILQSQYHRVIYRNIFWPLHASTEANNAGAVNTQD